MTKLEAQLKRNGLHGDHLPRNTLSFDETRYLACLVAGEHKPDFWNDNGRRKLIEKLNAIGADAVEGR